MTKIKCLKCNHRFEIPKGNCPICFSDELGEINDIKDSDKRFDTLTEFINSLCAFDYERGEHNAKCENQLIVGGVIGYDFEEIKENKRKIEDLSTSCHHKCIKNGIKDFRADCSICIENPDNDITDLQKAGRSYSP